MNSRGILVNLRSPGSFQCFPRNPFPQAPFRETSLMTPSPSDHPAGTRAQQTAIDLPTCMMKHSHNFVKSHCPYHLFPCFIYMIYLLFHHHRVTPTTSAPFSNKHCVFFSSSYSLTNTHSFSFSSASTTERHGS